METTTESRAGTSAFNNPELLGMVIYRNTGKYYDVTFLRTKETKNMMLVSELTHTYVFEDSKGDRLLVRRESVLIPELVNELLLIYDR